MVENNCIVALPSPEELICRIGKLVQLQAIAGPDVSRFYSLTLEDGIYRGYCLVPEFGQLYITLEPSDSLQASIYVEINSDFASGKVRHLVASRVSATGPWVFSGDENTLDIKDLERLVLFVHESPQDVYERCFDIWFHDYAGIVPESFTWDMVQSIFD